MKRKISFTRVRKRDSCRRKMTLSSSSLVLNFWLRSHANPCLVGPSASTADLDTTVTYTLLSSLDLNHAIFHYTPPSSIKILTTLHSYDVLLHSSNKRI